MTADLGRVVDRIRAQSAGGAPWHLTADELVSLLGIEPAELYRRVYAASLKERPLLELGAATGSFGPESSGELVALLELFYGVEAERRLDEAGVHLSHERRVELQETFLSVGARVFGSHHLDAETFSSMLRAFGGYERARDAYLAEVAGEESLIQEAAELFCARRRFASPELARSTAAWTLRLFFRRKVLSLEEAASPLIHKLRAQAAREGYVREQGPGTARPDAVPDDTAAARERALGVMELAGRRLTPELLRVQYRKLMKRFHPDLNPDGLERSKEINSAYALLSSALG